MSNEQKTQLKSLLFLAKSTGVYPAMCLARDNTEIFAEFIDSLPSELLSQLSPDLK